MVEGILWLPRTSPTVTLIDAIARDCSTRDDGQDDAIINIADTNMNAANQDTSSDNEKDLIDPANAQSDWPADVKKHLDIEKLRTLTPGDPEAQHISNKPGYSRSNGTSGLLIRLVLQIFIPKECREDLVQEFHLECSHGVHPAN
ncbi:hypothetical protein FOL47_002884 [Perkinsus chesapeaki]|uniref:Uncharacterized protein n=1 Tax=Perkinsus chesapeaki TaxID=330153 RepID=A0A7J6KQ62_PERCH|nr:hypothetical protein FOL47_002884 [Perkinsus chesapeaki]